MSSLSQGALQLHSSVFTYVMSYMDRSSALSSMHVTASLVLVLASNNLRCPVSSVSFRESQVPESRETYPYESRLPPVHWASKRLARHSKALHSRLSHHWQYSSALLLNSSGFSQRRRILFENISRATGGVVSKESDQNGVSDKNRIAK
jgi:hypothetical protein